MTDLLSRYDALTAERESLVAHGISDPFKVSMEKVLSPTRALINGKETILAGTYNYMGMTFHPEVIAAGEASLRENGAGTTGSRVLNGTFGAHLAVEDALKDFYDVAHAIVFSTGYLANLGLCSALTGRGDYIIIDADSHASIYDGCAMGSADIVRFRHNSAEDLEKRLKRIPEGAGKLVVLEGVYSMLGDVAPLKELVAVAKSHGAMVMVDEAHSMGFIGPNGRGVTEAAGVEDQVDFIVGTFSKSVGTVGGFAVSNHPKFDVLRVACRPYMFTASLPPSVMASSEKSIRLIKSETSRRKQLWTNVEQMHSGLISRGFQLATQSPESAIVSVLLPNQLATAKMWSALLARGIYVNMARPPATPLGTFLLRMSLCASHTQAQISTILDAFMGAADDTDLELGSQQAAE